MSKQFKEVPEKSQVAKKFKDGQKSSYPKPTAHVDQPQDSKIDKSLLILNPQVDKSLLILNQQLMLTSLRFKDGQKSSYPKPTSGQKSSYSKPTSGQKSSYPKPTAHVDQPCGW